VSDPRQPWPESLEEHVAHVGRLVQGDTGTNRLSFEVARLHARVALDAACTQDRAAKALTAATNRLAWVTLGLVLATVALVIVTLAK
jgi:hypothetical protein